MKVLHAPLEVAGQVGLEVDGLRSLGHHADAWARPHTFDFRPAPDRVLRPAGWAAKLEALTLVRPAAAYDVVHFHGGGSFLPQRTGYADVRLLRRKGVKVVQHFCGSDARLPDTELARNRWYVNSYGEDESVNRRRLARWSELTGGHVAFQDHSFDLFLQPYFDRIHIVPLAVDVTRLKPEVGRPPRVRPLVVHAPSQRAFKGTEVVRSVVEALQSDGVAMDYVEVHGRSHDETLAQLLEADVVIDQLRAGAYGTVTAEAMAMGKPVICYILPELTESYGPDFPVVSADPDSLRQVLTDLLQSPDERQRIGEASRRYAERVHDHHKVAALLVDVYRELP